MTRTKIVVVAAEDDLFPVVDPDMDEPRGPRSQPGSWLEGGELVPADADGLEQQILGRLLAVQGGHRGRA